MSTQLDFSIGIGKESEYGTAVTPTDFPEAEAKMKYDVKTVTSNGNRLGKHVARTNRNTITRYEGSGDVEFDATTKGLGLWLEAVLGSVTNTEIPATSPSVYQQNHVLSTSDPVPTYTIQEVLPTLGGVNSYPHTFLGCAIESLELSAKEGGYVGVKFGVTAREMRTDVSATAAAYASGDDLFTFVGGSIGYGGTLTAPTTTEKASLSGDPAANVAEVSVSIKRSFDTGGFNLGGAGLRSRAPRLGRPQLMGKIVAEYENNTLRDAYLSQTPLPLVLTFEGPKDLSTGVPALLQVVFPAVKLKGEIPTSDGGNPIKQSIDFEAMDNGVAAQPVWVVYRTLDTTP